MYDLTVSIVTYENFELLTQTISSCLNTQLKTKVYVIDNSDNDRIRHSCLDSRIEYIFTEYNMGYGSANNIALREAIDYSKYHLVLNPDIYFPSNALIDLYNFMEANDNVGLVMPTICNLDGTNQYLCKLLPNPYDLLIRRFFPIRALKRKRNRTFELRFTNYNQVMDISFLSGCFMFLRTEAIKKVGLFDERFFLYMEDVDLCRRIHKYFRTVFYPDAHVYHQNGKGSYKNLQLLKHHIFSAIKYFNKWGWFVDEERKSINKKILNDLKKLVP